MCFGQVCSNLGEILEGLMRVCNVDVSKYGMGEWPVIVETLNEQREALRHIIGPDYDKQPLQINRHPLRGYCLKRHSLYATLWNRHARSDLQESYQLLQGHLLIAHVNLIRKIGDLETYETYTENKSILDSYASSLERSANYVRDLSLTQQDDVFHNIPFDRDILCFARSILFIRMTKSSVEQPEYVRALGLFFYHAYDRQGHEPAAGGKGGGKLNHWKRIQHDGFVNLTPEITMDASNSEDPGDDNGFWGSHYTVRRRRGTRQRQEEWEVADLDPDENSEDEEVCLSDYGCENKKNAVVSQILSAKGQSRHVAMANQLLPNSWSQMTLWEVATLVKTCGDSFRAINLQDLPSDQDMMLVETITLVLTMLFTGSNLDRAKKLLFATSDDLGSSPLVYIKDTCEWRIRAHLSDYRLLFTDDMNNRSYKRTEHVVLPDIYNLGGYITYLNENRIDVSFPTQVFSRASKTYRASLKKLLRTLPTGHRVTEHKISSYLFNRMLELTTCDVAEAVLITGQYHRLGRTLLHYTTPPMSYIRSRYSEAVQGMVKAIYQEAYGRLPPQAKPVMDSQELYLGRAPCPRIEEVQKYVSDLQRALAVTKPKRTDNAYRRYHNIYTIYTAQMFAYSTGYRAVTDPFLWGDQVDEVTGLGVISDKDGPDFYNSRVVWVPEPVRRQLQHYAEHTKVILQECGAKHVFQTVVSGEHPPGMFFLDENWRLQHIRPATAAPFLKEFLDFPLNINRRFLRTYLRQRGCVAEVVNGYMGHWAHGEEPWGEFSTFSYSDYAKYIQGHIDKLVNELGWKTIKSKLLR
jgi:hypothetical protein